MKKKILTAVFAMALLLGTVTSPVLPIKAAGGNWIYSGAWWYQHEDGGYTTGGWEYIDDHWYLFDGAGWMLTGWQLAGGTWYYLDASGAMAADAWIGDYYVTGSGAMATNTWIGPYYVGADGAWIPNYQPAGWVLSGDRWWYRHADGSYTTNGWEYIGGNWYLFDGAGWMLTGWQSVGGTWYYLDPSGAMAANTWIGNYYVTGSGAMATDTWIDGYYVDGSGLWVPGAQPAGGSGSTSVEGKWIEDQWGRYWYRHEDGSYTSNGWETIEGQTYYFDSEGWMVTDSWIGDSYVGPDGVMAANTWVGDRYVDANGTWEPDKKPTGWVQNYEGRWAFYQADGTQLMGPIYILRDGTPYQVYTQHDRGDGQMYTRAYVPVDGSVYFIAADGYTPKPYFIKGTSTRTTQEVTDGERNPYLMISDSGAIIGAWF